MPGLVVESSTIEQRQPTAIGMCKNFFKVSGLRFLEMSAFGIALRDGRYRNNRAQHA
jgi:hypothetical protein